MQRFKVFLGALILCLIGLGLSKAGFSGKQAFSSVIFLMILTGTLFYWKFRLAFALTGLAGLLAGGMLDIPHLVEFAGLDIILFLFGMMAVIGFLEENHFFEYLVAKAVDRIGERPNLLIACVMILATLFAALVDEVTSILFMLSSVFHIARRYRMRYEPFLLIAVFATNIGSSATAVGNPIGVMIALRAGFTFMDFLRWAAPISLVCLTVSIFLCFFLFRRDIATLGARMREPGNEPHEAKDISVQIRAVRFSAFFFGALLLFLILHHPLEELLHLERNTLLIATALLFGGAAIAMKGNDARNFFIRRVDWWTLSFFMALFASVGTLKYTGVTEQVARGMLSAAGGSPTLLLDLFTAMICLLTAFMDNVLAVATFIPIVSDLEKAGINIFPFWWAMLFGGTMFGNATIIGSTANIVGMGMLEKESGDHIPFMRWLKPGLVVSGFTILVAMGLLYLQMPLMPSSGSH